MASIRGQRKRLRISQRELGLLLDVSTMTMTRPPRCREHAPALQLIPILEFPSQLTPVPFAQRHLLRLYGTRPQLGRTV